MARAVMPPLAGRAREPARVTTFAAREGDRLLLCSDGLTDVVGDDTIAAALAHRPADRCAERLVEAAALGERLDPADRVGDRRLRRELVPQSLGGAAVGRFAEDLGDRGPRAFRC